PRDVIERFGTLGDRQARRLRERRRRRRDGLLHVLGVRHADLCDQRVVERVLHLERAVTGTPLPVYEIGTDGHDLVRTTFPFLAFPFWLSFLAFLRSRKRGAHR